jgi:hypothetical protein
VPLTNDPGHASVRHMSYLVARDMWTLDQQRIHLLKKFGINNERVDQLHGAWAVPVAKTQRHTQGITYDCPRPMPSRRQLAERCWRRKLRCRIVSTIHSIARRVAHSVSSRAPIPTWRRRRRTC